ncbi:MAG: hypothetical protein JWM90_1174 [Thermoleophilia bacterium]|nr:hypothetical protein [Thermoleophilia bacterium]
MKLRRIAIERMPGVSRVEADQIGPGITVVTGPNESGKTSLVRAVRALLWGIEPVAGQPVDVAADIELASGEARRVWREGARTRWEQASGGDAEQPLLPDAAYAGCFTIELDQLANLKDDATSNRLARELAAELTGGIDVVAARAALRAQTPTGRVEIKELRERRRDYDTAHGAQRALAARHEQVEELRAELARLDAMRSRERDLAGAIDVVRARTRLASLEQELATYPVDALAATQGDDREQHAKLVTRLATARTQLAAAEQIVAEAQAATAASTGASHAEPGQIEELRDLATQLAAAEVQLAHARSTAASADARRDIAARALAGTATSTSAAPSPVDVPAAALEQARQLAVRRSDLEHRRRELEGRRDTVASEPAPVEDPAASARDDRASGVPLLVSLVVALAAAAIAILVAPIVWLLVAGIVLVAALQRRAARPARPRHDARHDARHAREVLRREFDAQLEALTAEHRKLAEVTASFLATHGIEAGVGVGAIAEVLGRMAQARETAVDAVAAMAAITTVEDQVAQLHTRIADIAVPLGQPAPVDAAAARSSCDVLDAARRAHDAARERASNAAADVTDKQAIATELQAELEAFRTARGVAAGTAEAAALEQLTALWNRRASWLALVQSITEERAVERNALTRVAPSAHEDLLARAAEELEAEHVDCRDAASRHDDVLQELNSLIGSVAAATAATTVGDALLALDAAADELAATRDEALRLATAEFLLDDAAASYERTASPRILDDANDFLARATAGRYALAIGEDQQIAAKDLRALHAPTRPLAALSGGTRAQLLIATRLAFARSAELGEPLPVFIDEALTTSDPERFEAVFEALAAIAEVDGRQFLYLTSNAADAALVDAVLTRAGRAPAQHVQLGVPNTETPVRELPAASVVAAPGAGEPSEAYATRLGVQQLDLHADPESIHVWHLLEPDTALVHQLVAARVTRIGELRNLASRGLLERIIGSDGVVAVRVALIAWDTFVPQWRKGRSRPFAHRDDVREVLVLADIKPDTWLDRVWDAAVQLDRDPERLVTGIRAGVVKVTGFGSKVDDLEHALRRSGHLPAEELVDAVVVEATVRHALPLDATTDATDKARRWMQRATEGD